MTEGVVSPLTVLAVALLLCTDLAESQCTTKYCEDHDEANLLSMCMEAPYLSSFVRITEIFR